MIGATLILSTADCHESKCCVSLHVCRTGRPHGSVLSTWTMKRVGTEKEREREGERESCIRNNFHGE